MFLLIELKVFQQETASRSGHEIVWLKHLAEELASEEPGTQLSILPP